MSTRQQWTEYRRRLSGLNQINAGNRARGLMLRSGVDFLRSRGLFESSISGVWQSKLWALSARFEAHQRMIEALNTAAAAVDSAAAALVSLPDNSDFEIRAIAGSGEAIQAAATIPAGLGFAPVLPFVVKAGAALLGGLLVYAGLSKVSDTIIEAKSLEAAMQAAGLEMDRAIASNPSIIGDWARYKSAISAQSGNGGALSKLGSGAVVVGLIAVVAWFIIRRLGDR